MNPHNLNGDILAILQSPNLLEILSPQILERAANEIERLRRENDEMYNTILRVEHQYGVLLSENIRLKRPSPIDISGVLE